MQAQKYYEWAVSDPRIIGALTHNPALAWLLLLPACSAADPCCCAAGIVIFPWAGDSAGWTPLSGGAYAGLNVGLGPHLQPNATRTWAEIGTKIRAGQGQSLPVLGGETRSPLDEVRAEAEAEEMPASLEEAHRMIRSLRAQLRAVG